MSKIEKALKRAASERHLALVPRGNEEVDPGGHRHHPMKASAVALGVETRAQSSAAIALMREAAPRLPHELTDRGIIHPETGETAVVKAFREIRTKVLQATAGHNCVLMVTSVSGGSGSTFVAANLASAFAFDERKTSILFDCNFASPSVHLLLDDPSALGLADYLENPGVNVEDIIHSVGIQRMRVVPAGGRRETAGGESFTSSRMKALIEAVRARYRERFVILDAPPMTESADTQILVDLCDYVILVIPYGAATHGQVDSCVRALDRRKLLGVVFNDEPQFPRIRRGRRPGQ